MDDAKLLEADGVVMVLRSSILTGGHSLEFIPDAVARLIRENLWQERIDSHTRSVERFATFDEFVETKPSRGLGTTVRRLQQLCQDRPDVLDLIDQARQRPNGINQYSEGFDNVQTLAPTGNSTDAALRRLRKDRPDLHQRVINKELSAHAAMIEAGFRKKTFTLPEEPRAAARALYHHYNCNDFQVLLTALHEEWQHEQSPQNSPYH